MAKSIINRISHPGKGAQRSRCQLGRNHQWNTTSRQCDNNARYRVDGIALCKRHAGLFIIDRIEAGDFELTDRRK